MNDDRDAPEPRILFPEELARILADHQRWVESDGKEGERADLSGASLPKAALVDANLRRALLARANFQRAFLRKANLQGAILREADLQGADLSGANLQGSVLTETKFQGANLAYATLERCERSESDLPEGELPGADLTGANLRNADLSTFIALLLGCVYSWLTIATTTDVGLVTNSASSPLPIIGTEIPVVGFYWAAPALLLAMYLCLHLYMQRLWTERATLPAIFPDGKPRCCCSRGRSGWAQTVSVRLDMVCIG